MEPALRNTIAETCKILKLSEATLYRRIEAGLLKTTKDGGRSFVSRAEILRYLAACEATPQPDSAAHTTTQPA